MGSRQAYWTGSAGVDVDLGEDVFQNANMLGVNTAAGTINHLAVAADATTEELTAPAGINSGQTTPTHGKEDTWIPHLTIGGTVNGINYEEKCGVYPCIYNLVMRNAPLICMHTARQLARR